MFRPSVVAKFVQFSTPLEGDELAPYPDNRNLITVGIGCLLDSPGFALALPLTWQLPDGSKASNAEVVRQLSALKALDLRNWPATSSRVLGATTIRLTQDSVLALCSARLALIEPLALEAFPAFASWPADAQLFWASICWAEGAGAAGINPNLARVLNMVPPGFLLAIEHAPDPRHPGMFLGAAADISTKNNPGIAPRNAQNALALSNAQLVQERGLDPSVLYWPSTPLLAGTS